jgi:plastocyanin/uncharacterized protein YjdB
MARLPFGLRLAWDHGATRNTREGTRRRRRADHCLELEPLEVRALLATVTVNIINFAFTPNPVTINVGDTVHWVWQSNNHSTTSATINGTPQAESWNSGVVNLGATFDHTFTHAGTFGYYCSIHGFDNRDGTGGGMAGTIMVTGGAPTLQSILVTPANPSIIKGASQQFTATGTFSDGSMQVLTSQVAWSSVTTSVATITAGGFATGVGAGTSIIEAVDNGVSGSTTLTVNAPSLRSILVTPSDPSITKGTTEAFTATGTYSDNSTQNLTSQVSWSSSLTTVATINATGVATGVGSGTSTISATMGSISGTTMLTVVQPSLQSIAVTPINPSIGKGATQAFTATGTYADNSTQNLTSQVTWSSGTTSVATINAAGVATAVGTGTSTILATMGNVSGSTVLTVTQPVLQSIAVRPSNPSIGKGTTQAFTATGTFSDSSTQDLTGQVTWSSDTTSVATISATGVATGVSAGTATISATMGNITGTTKLTVTQPTVKSIVVSPASPSVAKGNTQAFTAMGTFSDNSVQDVTGQVAWSSAPTSVATINASGVATGVGIGTATITATIGNVMGQAVLTVTQPVLKSIAVNPATPTINQGTNQQFTAIGTFTDGSMQDLSTQVAWMSDTTPVATVNASGLATGVSGGTATITAALNGVSAHALLTVNPVTLQSITVTPAGATIPKGTTQQFTARGTFSDGLTQDLTDQVAWSSDTAGVATISATGLATGVAQGSAMITATLNGKSGSTSLSVGPAVIQSITVTPAVPSIPKGETDQFHATEVFSDGTTQDVTSQVAWASGTQGIATIDASGLATGVAQGTASITATLNGVVGTGSLTVGTAVLQSITVAPPGPSIPNGETQAFTASGMYSDGSTQDLTSQVAWSSGTIGVATINTAGLATAVSQGTSVIMAMLNGVTGTTTLTVGAPVVQSITVAPASATIPKGRTEPFMATEMFSDGTTQDITNQVTWTSTTTTVATINPSSGVATGVYPGKSSITATLGSMSGSVILTVGPAVVQSITVAPASPSIPAGETEQFTASGVFSDGSTQDISSQVAWASDTATVATINPAGLATADNPGTSAIKATLNGVAGSTVFTVGPAVVQSIVVSPANPTVQQGGTQAFTAMGTFSNHSTRDITSQVTWTSSAANVATINASGVATAVAPGSASVSAALGGITGSTGLTVTPTPTPTPSPTPTPTPGPAPAVSGEQRLFTGTGRKKKLVGFQVAFNTNAELNAGVAANTANYSVVQAGRTKKSKPVSVAVQAAHYDPGTNSVMFTLGKFNAKRPLTLTATGLVSATGTPASKIVVPL